MVMVMEILKVIVMVMMSLDLQEGSVQSIQSSRVILESHCNNLFKFHKARGREPARLSHATLSLPLWYEAEFLN